MCENKVGETWFDDSWNWKLEAGKRILFWEDVWCGDVSLRDKFSRLFNNSNQKKPILMKLGSGTEMNVSVSCLGEGLSLRINV